MTRLTKEEVRTFIEERYPLSKIVTIEMIDERETMAFVLLYDNASVVSRIVVDITSEGNIGTWSIENARFEECYRREEI